MKEALFYEKLQNNSVKCVLCYHGCVIGNNEKGFCKVRENKEGKLFSNVYCRIVAKNIDPVEKKPLYHFLPGTYTYSFSTVGCNLKCKNCQNYEISQPVDIYGVYLSPEEIISEVAENRLKSVSYTYTEPTVYYETARDTGFIAIENNIKNIFVSNGFMSKEVVQDASKWLHAINIDLKSFSNDFYRKICKASLKPVLDNIFLFKEKGVWVEITTLLIPGYNDSEKEIREIAKFIKSVDKSIPWHISAFYPTYLLTDAPPASPEKVKKARLIGIAEGLDYVYTGNIRDIEGGTTFCRNCGEVLIARVGYSVNTVNLQGNRCGNCGESVAGCFV